VLRTLGASACDMEKGQFRCEPNVNVKVRMPGESAGETVGELVATRVVELKNLNSFASLRQAIEHERERQVRELLAGAPPGPRPKSTRGWDEARRETFLQREKEAPRDYRGFPEPDLPPVASARAVAERLAESLPLLPRARRQRFVERFGLPEQDAAVLAADHVLAAWYEAVAEASGDPRLAANWTVTDVLREANARGVPVTELPFAPQDLGRLLRAVSRNRVPREAVKATVFPEMAATGRPWEEIVAERGLAAISADDLAAVVREVVDAHPDLVERYRAGKPAVRGVLVGEVLQRTRGSADPRLVQDLLDRLLHGDSLH